MEIPYRETCVYIFIISHGVLVLAMPPLIGPLGHGGSSQIFRQAQFGESIRDWFINVRDRIFGNSHSPDFSALMNQAKEDYREQKKLIEGFWLDLTNLSFDPERDWGFHLGPWFIIRKSNDNSNADNPGTPRPGLENIGPLETQWNRSNTDNRSWTELIPTIMTLDTTEMTTHTMEENTISNIDVDKAEDISTKHNETFSHSTSDESARLLLSQN